MAGDWIKMRSNLHEDPRVVQIAAELSADELHVVGLLWRAWSWADSQSLTGDSIAVTESFLDRIVRRDGFSVALRKVGWLEGRNGSLTFPRFAEHNGQTAKSRADGQKRVAEHRDRKCVTEKRYNCNDDPLPEKSREEKTDTIPPIPPPPPAAAGDCRTQGITPSPRSGAVSTSRHSTVTPTSQKAVISAPYRGS
jgi:hypothetical protein